MSRSKTKLIILVLLLLVLLVLFGVYLGGAKFFESHFFPNTTVNGINVSQKDADFLQDKNIQTGDNYLITICDRDGDRYNLIGPNFAYAYAGTGTEQTLLDDQNNYAWLSEWSKTHNLTLDTAFTYDGEKLKEAILALPLFEKEATAPVNAYLDRNESGMYEIVPELYGDTLISDNVVTEIAIAVSQGLTEYTLSDDCYLKPDILSDDEMLSATLSKINHYCSSTITYEIEGAHEGLNASAIAALLVIGEDGSVELNDDKITSYVQSLASTYNTYGDVRSFKTSKGDVVKIGGGDYGWVIAKKKEAAQLKEDLAGGVPVKREPIYEQTAKVSGMQDIGNTYVEIDYTNQHLYYYEDGKLIVESDIVSGCIRDGNGSPDGIFKIVYKQSPATLVGETYESNVSYFMPFAYNVGIHDASWRNGKFGGDIYINNGSHGCINVPLETAQELYGLLEKGIPVVAYYREPVELKSESSKISNAYSYVEPEETK